MKTQDRFIAMRAPARLYEQLSTASRKWQIPKQQILISLLNMVLNDAALRDQLHNTLEASTDELAKED